MFDDAKLKREQLHAIFESLQDVVIYGVVGANGATAGRVPPEKTWSLNFRLIAWRRIPGGLVVREGLRVSQQVSEEELRSLQAAIASNSLVCVRARICEDSPFGDARAQLVSVLPKPTDYELELILAQYLEPVVIHDEALGTLTLNRSVNWFEGKVTWLGKVIAISVLVDEAGSPESSLKTAHALLERAGHWHEKVADFAISELLELKNDNWRDEEDEPVTRADFLSRMDLSSLAVDADGSFDFWHDDGELFCGHSILVSGSLSEGLTSADIPG